MKREIVALLSNDVETTSIWFNDLRDETGEKVLIEGMPRLLDLYAKYNVKSTFFYTGYMAKLYPEVVKMAVDAGHEVGSHGKSHIKENGFDIMPYDQQIRHLDYSKKLLEDISGQEVISFRAPALRVSPNTAMALLETGFKIDSSIASQRFDFFLSFGSKQKLSFLNAPRLPYWANKNNIFKKGQSDLLELPLSATLLPYAGTTMRIMPGITKAQQKLLHLESLTNGKPVVFVIHPNEFIDESAEPRSIKRRSVNPIAYLLSDLVRAKLKVKNLGENAVPIYERLISWYAEAGYEFMTMGEYRKMLEVSRKL
ncbi:MAG: polysaccharide deacetylase family protein [Methanosarcina sp.]|jgi:peptidoglycan/xylan/chitin deacetylase (PgdA/CDA1 family)|nr:polysaccharide deacetylase family protein [Methanosarcina sp.]